MKLNIQLFADGEVVIPVNLETKSFDRQIAYLESKLESLENMFDVYANASDLTSKEQEEFKKLGAEIENTKNKIIGLQKQQLKVNQVTEEYDKSLTKVEKTTSEINSSIKQQSGLFGGIWKKITSMGLAIFGIRSAYMLIRQSMSEIAQNNDSVANKLNIIKSSLATAIAPIAEQLVNIVYKLLAYLNVITKTFFGIDLFKKSAKSSKQTLSNAQKLKKTLASFDEMNILQDTSSAGGGGGGTAGGIKIEEPDTTDFEKVVKKFKNMWNEILDINRNEAEQLFLDTDKVWGQFKIGLFDWVQGWIRIFQGFWDTIKGLWDIVVGWANDDDKKIQGGIQKVKDGIIRLLKGFGQILIAPWELAVGVIKGLLKEFVGSLSTLLKKYVLDPIYNTLTKIRDRIKENFKGGFWKGLLNTLIDYINYFIKKINSKLTISIGGTLSKILGALGIKVSAGNYTLFKIPEIPRLAKGGIINMPGRGVPVGSALAGERGAEGVIPLTDSQQMALLGEAIGRYITINAQITNTMNGRVISRELQKIQQENSFASNR